MAVVTKIVEICDRAMKSKCQNRISLVDYHDGVPQIASEIPLVIPDRDTTDADMDKLFSIIERDNTGWESQEMPAFFYQTPIIMRKYLSMDD
jgi:hypothetical protein